jgi:pyruvate dehydrogenase E1 component
LDNLGSVVGVKQECLAVRKHSRCGRPSDVYRYHHIDSASVIEACLKVLAETAMENLVLPSSSYAEMQNASPEEQDWRHLVAGK